jgi:hypothetical protein
MRSVVAGLVSVVAIAAFAPFNRLVPYLKSVAGSW